MRIKVGHVSIILLLRLPHVEFGQLSSPRLLLLLFLSLAQSQLFITLFPEDSPIHFLSLSLVFVCPMLSDLHLSTLLHRARHAPTFIILL